MKKALKFIISYSTWILNLGLAFWLFYISRTTLLGILALFYEKGEWAYSKAVDFTDKVFTIVLILAWVVFMVIVEEYFRKGVHKGLFMQRAARVTGIILLSLFTVDLILLWLQGISAANSLRWLVLALELGVGTALIASINSRWIKKTF